MDTTQLLPPKLLVEGSEIAAGRYRVIRVLGTGGMGTVYLCAQTNPQREVVIKFPHPNLMLQAGFRERFEAEIQFMISLDHPGVVSVYETGDHNGLPFAVLQYLAGGSLADRLAESGNRQTVDEINKWLMPVSKTLDSIHEDGVLHRDIKPDNILFDRRGHAYLSDFGISKAITEAASSPSDLTATGMFIGSPRYVPPEYIDRKFSPAGDQYSLAAVVYYSLTGRPPHNATTNERLLVDKATITPKLASELVGGLPNDSVEALATGLAIDPDDRFASCAQFTAMFNGAAPELAVTQSIVSKAVADPSSPARRRRLWPATLAALGLLSAVAAVFFLTNLTGEQPPTFSEASQRAGQNTPNIENTRAPETTSASASNVPHPAEETAPAIEAKTVVPEKDTPPMPGYLLIQTNVSVDRVMVDGKVVSITDSTPIELIAGEHVLRVEKEGYLPFETSLTTKPEATETLQIALVLTPEEAAKRLEAERRGLVAQAEQERQKAARLEEERRGLAAQAEQERQKAARLEAERQRAARRAKQRSEQAEEKGRLQRLQMVAVPAGEFWYGCNQRMDQECDKDELPGETKTLPAFVIDRTEVTVEAFGRCVDAAACSDAGLEIPFFSGKPQTTFAKNCNWDQPNRADHPINCVNWHQAEAFCEWKGGRLPSAFEWEKAARGTDARKYPWGNRRYGSAKRVANIADETARKEQPSWSWAAAGYDDGHYTTAPVGTYPSGASPYGALDMIGNVWEWTSDWSDESQTRRELRGGAWDLKPQFARISNHNSFEPQARYVSIGFRCAQ